MLSKSLTFLVVSPPHKLIENFFVLDLGILKSFQDFFIKVFIIQNQK